MNLMVEAEFDGRGGGYSCYLPTAPYFSILDGYFQHDDPAFSGRFEGCYKRIMVFCQFSQKQIAFINKLLKILLRISESQNKMSDNIRRAMQDIDLGREDASFALPLDVVRQAAEENRFILIGRPAMPRRQNVRPLIATMPRVWGLEEVVRGRLLEGRRSQFVFPSEEAMDTMIRCGPWAYADRMLVFQSVTIFS